MKVPLRDLEEARRDPGAYLRERESRGSGFFFKSGYATLQRAVYRFHKPDGNLALAQQYLEESFIRQFKHHTRLPHYMHQLEQYTRELNRLGTIVFKVKDRLVVPLPEEFGRQVRVSGDIPRVDLTDEGYNVWLFAKETSQWEEELRLPIIQSAYASKLAVPNDEIKVGVYDFSTVAYTTYRFSERELMTAKRALLRLLRQLTSKQV